MPAPLTRRRSPPGSPLHRRAWGGLHRRIAIPLTIRSHQRNAVREAPAGDLYHGMAFMGIPVALDLGKRDRKPVVYDARDIYLNARNLARMGRPARWFLGRLERGWAKRASRVVTVNEAYADVMAGRWPVERPLVVMNCSFRYTPPSPRERRFHEHLGLDPSEKVVLYHGGLFPWRGIEQLIEAIPLVPGATLVLMGYGILEPTLKAWEADPATGGKVRVMGAVPPDQLHDWVAAADVAAMPIQGDTLNHRLTTPKSCSRPWRPACRRSCRTCRGCARSSTRHGLGHPRRPDRHRGRSPIAIRRIVQLPEDEWLAWRQRCLDAAHDRYNWETQVEALLDEYGRLTGKPLVSDAGPTNPERRRRAVILVGQPGQPVLAGDPHRANARRERLRRRDCRAARGGYGRTRRGRSARHPPLPAEWTVRRRWRPRTAHLRRGRCRPPGPRPSLPRRVLRRLRYIPTRVLRIAPQPLGRRGSCGRTPSAAGGTRSSASSSRPTSTTRAASLAIPAALAARKRDRRAGRRSRVIHDVIDLQLESNNVLGMPTARSDASSPAASAAGHVRPTRTPR